MNDAPWANGDWEAPYVDMLVDEQRDFAEEDFNARLMCEE